MAPLHLQKKDFGWLLASVLASASPFFDFFFPGFFFLEEVFFDFEKIPNMLQIISVTGVFIHTR